MIQLIMINLLLIKDSLKMIKYMVAVMILPLTVKNLPLITKIE